jgi:uncharacterized membrane protein YeaQ/YmgE (transglycosylase-associated protein family)
MNVLRLLVAVTVTLIWAAAWIAAIVTGDYEGVGAITPVMLGVVGYLFAREWMSARNGKDRDRD